MSQPAPPLGNASASPGTPLPLAAFPERETLRRVMEQFRRATADFVCQGTLLELRNYRRRIAFELPDLVLATLLAGQNLLLTGSSGTGKTYLAQRALRGLFGEDGYGVLNVTPGLDEDVLFDVDLGVHLRGGRLTESIKAGPLLTNWGLVIDDMYRAHAKLRNILLAVVRAEPWERRVSAKGGGWVPVGRAYPKGVGGRVLPMAGDPDNNSGSEVPKGPRWFSVIATANPPRGGEFSGNYDADAAETRRFAVIINVDRYAPRAAQLGRLFRSGPSRPPHAGTAADIGEPLSPQEVVALHAALQRVAVSEGAQLLALLAAAHNRCEKTADRLKPWNRLPDYCSSERVKCAVARHEGSICPYVGELAPASVQDLMAVARAVAALEWSAAAGAGEDVPPAPEVRMTHVKAVYPFVAAQKVWLHRRYYEDPDKFNGDVEAALRRVAEAMHQDVTDFKYQNEQLVAAVGVGGLAGLSGEETPTSAAGVGGGANVRVKLQSWARTRSPALADVLGSLLGLEAGPDEPRG